MNKSLSKAEQLLSLIIHAAVFLYPVLIVSIPDAGPTLFGVLALISIVVSIVLYPKLNSSREEKLLFFSSILIFSLALYTSYLGGFNELAWQKINSFLNLLMIVPLYIVFKNYLINTRLVWLGLFFGVVISGLIALYENQLGSLFGDWGGRASGATHPILFADIVLTMSFILLVASATVKKLNKKDIAALVVVIFLGFSAVILSGFKGVWVVLPVLTIFMFWRYKNYLPRKILLVFAVVVVILPVLFYLVPDSAVKVGVENTLQDIEVFSDGRQQRVVSIGTRIEMWRASWMVFIENPVAGTGWGHYIESAKKYVDLGLIDSTAISWNHPHNQYFSMMASGGLLMLIALIYFFIIPMDMFRRFLFFPEKEVQSYASAGLVLIISFIGYAVSEAIFERALSTGFYAFYLALFFALMYRKKKESCEQSVTRTEKLSVILIAYNEADRIDACLSSVAGWADEIIVFDNGSTDGTIDIAKKYTDKVFVTDWPGYGKQKQRALEKARYNWVFSIDADEQMTAALKNEIDKKLSSNPAETGFSVPWQVMIYNKRIDFGHNGRAPLRLFRRDLAKFSEVAVHEKVILSSGHVELLNERLLHFTHRNLKHAIEKYNDYAWLWAVERFEKGKRAAWRTAIINSAWSFLVGYIVKLGFLDGFRGFILAAHISMYTFNKYAALWTLEKQQDNSTTN